VGWFVVTCDQAFLFWENACFVAYLYASKELKTKVYMWHSPKSRCLAAKISMYRYEPSD